MATPYWAEVLDAADQRMNAGEVPFTHSEDMAANGWTTCACGKQDPRIPRMGITGGPLDRELRNAGLDFGLAVSSARELWQVGEKERARAEVKRARDVLNDIERHAARVLREVEAAGNGGA